MSRSRGGILLVITAALAGIAAAGTVWPAPAPETSFQRATCGVGLSSTVSVAWSFFGYDPRAEATCESELWPIPGLSCPNPGHGTSVVDLPPLPPDPASATPPE